MSLVGTRSQYWDTVDHVSRAAAVLRDVSGPENARKCDLGRLGWRGCWFEPSRGAFSVVLSLSFVAKLRSATFNQHRLFGMVLHVVNDISWRRATTS